MFDRQSVDYKMILVAFTRASHKVLCVAVVFIYDVMELAGFVM